MPSPALCAQCGGINPEFYHRCFAERSELVGAVANQPTGRDEVVMQLHGQCARHVVVTGTCELQTTGRGRDERRVVVRLITIKPSIAWATWGPARL